MSRFLFGPIPFDCRRTGSLALVIVVPRRSGDHSWAIRAEKRDEKLRRADSLGVLIILGHARIQFGRGVKGKGCLGRKQRRRGKVVYGMGCGGNVKIGFRQA